MGQQKPAFFCPDRQYQRWMFTAVTNQLIRLNRKNGQATRFYPADQPNGYISDIMESADGRIWLATTQGLAYFDERANRFQHFPPLNAGIPTNPTNSYFNQPVYRLYATPSGGILLAGLPYIIRFQPRTRATQAFALPNGPPDWGQANFTTDRAGRVYFEYSNRLARLTTQQGVEVLTQQQPENYKDWGTRL